MTRFRVTARPTVSAFVTAMLLFAGTAANGATDSAAGFLGGNPVVFVHGGFGSAGQFASQALRFSTNGYPDSHLAALEYDSLFGVKPRAEVLDDLDELIADLLEATGAEQVDLMGHSLGTALSQEYLGTPSRAANVAHYVNIDGAQADAPPGGVPTLAIWAGEGDPDREIVGAENVTLPDQTHVESATSEEAFAAMYRFLNGIGPRTLEVEQDLGVIELSGRALIFPQNVAPEGATVSIWELNRNDGTRRRAEPEATYPIGEDGAFGPFEATSGKRYEFTISREGVEREHRLHYEPFVRSNQFIRLLTSEPGGPIDSLIERSDDHVAMTIVRYKELWGDQFGENDVLRINGTNVINENTSPQSKRTIGLFVFDAGTDGMSDLDTPIPTIFGLPFLSGVDLVVPAQIPTRGTVKIQLTSRNDPRSVRQLRFPAVASTLAAVSVYLNDYEPPVRGLGRSALR
jgi:pimeloyl-ACP methyl ester carboxylesterase